MVGKEIFERSVEEFFIRKLLRTTKLEECIELFFYSLKLIGIKRCKIVILDTEKMTCSVYTSDGKNKVRLSKSFVQNFISESNMCLMDPSGFCLFSNERDKKIIADKKILCLSHHRYTKTDKDTLCGPMFSKDGLAGYILFVPDKSFSKSFFHIIVSIFSTYITKIRQFENLLQAKEMLKELSMKETMRSEVLIDMPKKVMGTADILELFELIPMEISPLFKCDYFGAIYYTSDGVKQNKKQYFKKLRENGKKLEDFKKLLGAYFDFIKLKKEKSEYNPRTRVKMLSFPLASGSNIYGVFALGWDKDVNLSEEDLSFLSILAEFISVAYEKIIKWKEEEINRIAKLAESENEATVIYDGHLNVIYKHEKKEGLIEYLIKNKKLKEIANNVLRTGTSTFFEFQKEADFYSIRIQTIKIGDRYCVLCSLRDITPEKKIMLSVLQTIKLASISEFSVVFVHTVNNPIQAFLSFSELVQERKDLPPDIKIWILTLHDIFAKLSQTLKNFLIFSKGPDRMDYTVFGLKEIISNIISLWGILFKRKDINLIFEAEENINDKIFGSPQLIQHAILNIVKNSYDACIDGKENNVGKNTYIKIKLKKDEDKVYMEIEDDGPGIPEKNKDKIFEPFFSSKKNGLGTGVGLTLVKRIVNEHKGNITFESEEGKGTRFIITLPLYKV